MLQNKLLLQIVDYSLVTVNQLAKHLLDNTVPWSLNSHMTQGTQKLQDVFIQQYRAYLNDEANSDKCLLAKTCDKGVYNMSHYLLNVNSPQIKSIIPKYR